MFTNQRKACVVNMNYLKYWQEQIWLLRVFLNESLVGSSCGFMVFVQYMVIRALFHFHLLQIRHTN